MQKPLNLFQKLIEVRKKIGYIKKSAQGYGYKYVKESDILLAMGEEMNNQGVFLEQIMDKFEVVSVNVKTKNGFIMTEGARITFQYVFTNAENPSETIVRTQVIQQPGTDAQTIGSVMTYGMKYFLFKTFNVAMDEYDIDAVDKNSQDYAPIQQTITQQQAQSLSKMIAVAGCSEKFMNWIYNNYKITQLDQIQTKDFDAVKNVLVDYLEKKQIPTMAIDQNAN